MEVADGPKRRGQHGLPRHRVGVGARAEQGAGDLPRAVADQQGHQAELVPAQQAAGARIEAANQPPPAELVPGDNAQAGRHHQRLDIHLAEQRGDRGEQEAAPREEGDGTAVEHRHAAGLADLPGPPIRLGELRQVLGRQRPSRR